MRNKTFLLIVTTILFVVLLDFSPAIYQSIFENGGTAVKTYHYDISGDSLLKIITEKFGNIKSKNEKLYITSVLPDKNGSGFTYVRLCSQNTNENMHFWVRTKQESFTKGTEIIFYGISNSDDFHNTRRINTEDYISRQLKINQFEGLVIDKINSEMGGT